MQAMENNRKKWVEGLARTRKSTFGKIAAFLGATEINAQTWDELEAMLIQSDIGAETSLDITQQAQAMVQEQGILREEELQTLLKEILLSRLKPPPELEINTKPFVILVAGVNGSGKTTTLAKLAKHFQEDGLKVQLTAADTYRAAAVEQLQIWGNRLDIPVVSGQQNGDPGAVVYDSIQSALAKDKDLVLIDTAGRLHTRYNLMEELKKVYRVAGKALTGAPHACWLVMDATTGQNALHQAASFQKAIPLDGVILAKLDSSAKGGMVFAVQDKLGLPILFAGLGEKPEDLVPFQPKAFIEGILAGD